VANLLDHETKSQVLLNIQATSGDPPSYGHTQVIYCLYTLFSKYKEHHLMLRRPLSLMWFFENLFFELAFWDCSFMILGGLGVCLSVL
jgi:hypothetical protein